MICEIYNRMCKTLDNFYDYSYEPVDTVTLKDFAVEVMFFLATALFIVFVYWWAVLLISLFDKEIHCKKRDERIGDK